MTKSQDVPLVSRGAYMEDAFQHATIDDLAQAAQLAS